MILTGYAIDEAVSRGDIHISPYDRGQIEYESVDEFGQINPASYDLRLGDEVAVYDRWVDTGQEKTRAGKQDGMYLTARRGSILDVKEEPQITKFKIIPGLGWVIWPGIGYLMATKERVNANKYVGVVDGKSSLGRLFLQAHSTAGYIDPAFDGEITLEVTSEHPIRVYADMLFAQIRFHRVEGRVMAYNGNYTGEAARGPIASRAWKQFQKVK